MDKDLVQRASGELTPWNAGDVVGLVVDVMREKGIPLAPMHKGMIARHSKALIEAGFAAHDVALGALLAVRRGEPHRMQWITQDLVIARAGQRLTRREYEEVLQDEVEIRRLEERRRERT